MTPNEFENNERNRKTITKIFIATTVVVIVSIFLFYQYRAFELKKNGVYIIGKVISVMNVENGYTATISYSFRNKKYSTVQKTLPAINDNFVFLLISEEQPSMCSLIKNSKVPLCLINRGYFDSCWSRIPGCQ
jgi:hypothetical protein